MGDMRSGGKAWLGSFLTLAVDGGVWLALHSGCFTHAGKEASVTIQQESGWTPELAWVKQKIMVSLLGIKPPFLSHPTISIVAVETEISRFSFRGE
jgi:hypothetical protein